MRTVKQILFTMVAVLGLSLAISAQKGGGNDKPPKKPPVIEPKPKDSPRPKGDDKPKKPGASYFVALINENEYSG